MMPKRSLDPKDIASLLSKLKDQTPEYPANMMEARKAAFLKQAASLKTQMDGKGGNDGGNAGNSGIGGSNAGLGGGATTSGFLLQALIAFSVVAALLLTAFAYRKQIVEVINGNDFAVVEEISTSVVVSTPTAGVTLSSETSPSSAEVTPTATVFVTPTPVITGTPDVLAGVSISGTPDGTIVVNETPDDTTVVNESSDDTKTNSGLHLGQTPGAPAAPGQGNPGNENQPDKATKEPKATKESK